MCEIKRIGWRHAPVRGRVTPVAVLLILTIACRSSGQAPASSASNTLTIGFGLAAGTDSEIGIQQVARSIAVEDLTVIGPDGNNLSKLAERWSTSEDGLTVQVHLRSTTFHSGTRIDAETVRQILQRQLPGSMGPAFADIADIRATGDGALEFVLRRRSNFLLEALGTTAIREPQTTLSGTGPFYVTRDTGNEIEMRANSRYYGGKPGIDRLIIKPFTSLRSAWAEMLRGHVDVLYDIGVDALDSLVTSNDVTIFAVQRPYAHLLLLNVKRPPLNDPRVRRALNEAVDRQALVSEVWAGHAAPADGPVWYRHWAYSRDVPRFGYHPRSITAEAPVHFTCLVVDPSHERLALLVQRQLLAVGAQVDMEFVSADKGGERLRSGDFDAVLADFLQGPNMVRPYLNWYSSGPNNWGHYSNHDVDTALDNIRLAADENAYRAGVSAFQRAIVDDPPAVFLTWRERARAVSRRFQVPSVPPGTDVFTTLRLWTPASTIGALSTN